MISEIGKEMLDFQEKLAKTYGYKPIEPNLFLGDVRQKYIDALPEWCKIEGDPECELYSERETLIATGYERIVIGDYGAFIEISPEQILQNKLKLAPGEEYRVYDERYSNNVKYHWYTTIVPAQIKLYYQQKAVTYADYKPGMWYVSVYEVFPVEEDDTKQFETLFEDRLGQTPIEWIKSKVSAGSKIEDIKYLYEITVAAIAQKNWCNPVPFEHYFSVKMGTEDTNGRKRVKTYNKLVRDRIPEIIEGKGSYCSVETLSERDYIKALDDKLNEELAEYQESRSLEELADLLEVMEAIVAARGYSVEELEKVRKQKREERGGFEKRIFLKETFELEEKSE